MSEEKVEERKLGEATQAKKVTLLALQGYFHYLEEKKGSDCTCPLCGGKNWLIPAAPHSDTVPVILTMPVAMSKGLGVWVFPIYCRDCAHMILLDTSKVVNHLEEKGLL